MGLSDNVLPALKERLGLRGAGRVGISGLAVLESGLTVTPTLGAGNAGLATRPNLIAPVTNPGAGKTNLGHPS